MRLHTGKGIFDLRFFLSMFTASYIKERGEIAESTIKDLAESYGNTRYMGSLADATRHGFRHACSVCGVSAAAAR